MTRHEQVDHLVTSWLDVTPTCTEAYRIAYARIEAQIIAAEQRARDECAQIARRMNAPEVAGAIGAGI